jgi:diguanylate cyclase (GGDEF)-like protein
MGDTSTEPFSDTGKDEIGDLHNSLLIVLNILHKLLEDINTMIDEHQKGNVEYSFATDEFLGDFKVLADSVLVLAAFSIRDQLTGLPNRRSFDNRLGMEWKRAIREQHNIGFLILDIDKFKNYNDSFGHQQGDVALQTVAQTIKQSVKRSLDFAARWGGEEFVVLLPATDSEGAMHFAEHLRGEIERAVIPCDNKKGETVTVSIGVYSYIPKPDETVNSFINTADNALYKAKADGRNRVVLGEDFTDFLLSDLHNF